MPEPTNYLPPSRLKKYILRYGILEIPEGVREPYFSPPLGLSGFILHTINSNNIVIAKIEARDFFTEQSVATGQVTKPVYGELVGKMKSIMVFFHPLGMYQLFARNMSLLTNTSMPLRDFVGKTEGEGLMKRLKADQDNDHQIEVLNTFFYGIKPVDTDTDKMEKVLDFIHERQGNVSVVELEKHGYYHRKTLERHFQKMIGLSPKKYIQIFQFKCLINLIRSHPGITWRELSNKAGYYDQSHMSRYFREYLNVAPNSVVKLDMELINYLLQ